MEWQQRMRAALMEPAYGLAALRIAVAGILLISPELHAARALAAAPARLVRVPEGIAWLAELSFTASSVGAVHTLAVCVGALTLLGYWTRVATALFALSATFLISFTQRAGAALHDMHLLWLLALLAVSPAGDVWSVDAWGERMPAPALRYGVPLCFARALLGVVYLFPGIHKLLDSGWTWASAHNITALLYGKWFQYGQVPSWRIDRWPSLLASGGGGVLLFELSFIMLALLPRTRWLALGSGLLFHVSTQLFFFISFYSLLVCYVMLLPWQRVLRRTRKLAETMAARDERWPWSSILVGGALLLGASIQGARGQTQSFPFACYPTFAGLRDLSAPDLIVELGAADGGAIRLERDFAQPRSQQEWSRIYALLGAYGGAAGDDQLRSFARERARALGQTRALQRASELRFIAADYSTEPSDWGKAPLRTRVLRVLTPDSAAVLRSPESR